MKRPILVLLVLLTSAGVAAASLPYVVDVETLGGDSDVTIESMAFMPSGDIAVTGQFTGVLEVAGVDTLFTPDAKEDVYLAVMSPEGVVQQIVSFGGLNHQLARDIDVDAQGNFVLCGTAFSRADLGGGVITIPGGLGPFVTMYDSNAEYLWGVVGDFDFASAVAFASNGDVLVTGVKFGYVGPPEPIGNQDVYLARYSPTGTLLFEIRLGSPAYDNGGDVAALPDGGCIVSGSVKVDPPYYSFPDAFLARYDAAGNQLWTSTWGGSRSESADTIAIGPDNSIYFGGHFKSPDAPLLVEPWRGVRDWYVAKADSNGVVQWINNGGSPDDEQVVALDVGHNGDVAVTGSVRGGFQEGDLVVAYFDAAGTESLQVVFPTVNDHDDQGRALLLDDNLDMLVGGVFTGTLDLTWYQLESRGGQDAFFARMRVPPLVTSTAPAARSILQQNFPNPFNPKTTIRFELDRARVVAIEIFDTRGRRVRTLDAGPRPRGTNEITWNGTDDSGAALASGVYRYRMVGEPDSRGLHMVLLR